MELPGLILAGGRSRRFGGDKRFYKLGGRTLLDIAVGKVGKVCYPLFISSDRADLPVRVPVLVDRQKYLGPLCGIYQALTESGIKAFLVLPVDMPWVSVRLLSRVYAAGMSGFNVCIRSHNGVYPFPGVYTREVILYRSERKGTKVMDFLRWAAIRGRLRVLNVSTDKELANLNFPP